MMIIRENIEFKRGRSSKEALDLGFRGLPKIFDEIFRIYDINLIEFEKYGNRWKGIDYIAFEMLNTRSDAKSKKLQNYIKSSNLFKFLENSSINTNDDVHSYLEYDIRPEYKVLFKKFIESFGSKRSAVSKVNDTLYPPEVIQESIEFKRGQDSKKSLGLGYQGLDELFETALEFPGMHRINFWNNAEDAYLNIVDFIEFIYEENDQYDLKEHLKEIGFLKFIDLNDQIGFDEEYLYKLVLINAEVKDQYRELLGLYANNYGTKVASGKFSFIKPDKNTNESINFKRTGSSRKGLKLGMEYILSPPFHFSLFSDGEYAVYADDAYKNSRENPEDFKWNTKIESKDGKIFQKYQWSTTLNNHIPWVDGPMYISDPQEWAKTNDIKEIIYLGPK